MPKRKGIGKKRGKGKGKKKTFFFKEQWEF